MENQNASRPVINKPVVLPNLLDSSKSKVKLIVDKASSVGDSKSRVIFGETLDFVWRPWRTFVIIALIICVILLIVGSVSKSLYNKMPVDFPQCVIPFNVDIDNAYLSIGSIGTLLFGITYFRMYFLNK
jgi:hypothetical protein